MNVSRPPIATPPTAISAPTTFWGMAARYTRKPRGHVCEGTKLSQSRIAAGSADVAAAALRAPSRGEQHLVRVASRERGPALPQRADIDRSRLVVVQAPACGVGCRSRPKCRRNERQARVVS